MVLFLIGFISSIPFPCNYVALHSLSLSCRVEVMKLCVVIYFSLLLTQSSLCQIVTEITSILLGEV